MTDSLTPMAIIWQEGGLWFAQEQGVCGRETIGGYASREACIEEAARTFGNNVRIEVEE